MADRIISTWAKSPLRELTDLQDQRNDEVFRDIIERPVRERSKLLAKQREAYYRELLEARMPRRLHWLIDRPRILKRVLRIVPRWEPTLIVNAPSTMTTTTAAGATDALTTWMRALEAAGQETRGIVFTYTDASGLPAEVYGPVR